jgi:hypothetical protein
MPTANLVFPSLCLVVTKCFDDVTLDDIAASALQIRNHPDFNPDFRQLIDLTRVVGLHLHYNDLYQLKHLHDPFSNEGKRAVVASADVVYGMSRMYQLILNTPFFEVFRSLADAAQWLELDPSFLENELQINPHRFPAPLRLL